MNCFSPKGMTKITQCTFGQECENAEAYNTARAEIVHGNNLKMGNLQRQNKYLVTSATLRNSWDYENFCKLFDISPNTLIKTLANSKSKIDKLWNFIFENVKGPTFCISVFTMSKKASINGKRIFVNDETQIFDFHFGSHFFIIVPVEKYLEPHNKEIKNLLQSDRAAYPSFLDNQGKILINYEEKLDCTKVYKYLSKVFKISYIREDQLCLSMTLLKWDEEKCIFDQELLLALAAKKLLYIIESKFPSESNYGDDETNMEVNDDKIYNASQQLTLEMNALNTMMNNGSPPRLIKQIYYDLKLFHNSFLKFIYLFSTNIAVCENLCNALKQACENILETPFEKIDEYWVIKDEERNTPKIDFNIGNKYCILFTEYTKKYLHQLYSENDEYCWIMTTTKNNMKNFQEPLLQNLDKNMYPIGIVNDETYEGEMTAHKLYIETCGCKPAKTDKKVWMCSRCKTFLFETLEDGECLKCNCGIHDLNEMDKSCVRCNENSITVYPKTSPRKKYSETAIKPNIEILYPHHSPEKVNNDAPSCPDPKNIIFVGQTGAGKSTLINSIANYIEFDFDEACKNPMKCYLPCQFQLQTPDFKNVVINDGPQDENESYNKAGQSVTQKPKTYHIETSNYIFNIIDTPGLGDSRGAEQDVLNVEYIRSAVHECEKIGAICFVIPSNISKLTTNFEMIMRDLLSIFPKTALKNVFFFFTYANSTFFSIGETRNPIDQFIAEFKVTNNAEIPFKPNNIYCVDSEAFMYFIATKKNHKYEHRTEESFEVSWNKSKEAVNEFLRTLNTIEPMKSDDIQEVYDLEQINIGLMKEKDMNPDLLKLCNYVAEASARNSMTSLASKLKNSTFKDVSKNKLEEALNLLQKVIKTPVLNEKISKYLEKYFVENTKVTSNGNLLKNQNSSVMTESVEKNLKETAAVLADLWDKNEIDKIYGNALFDIYHACFTKNRLPKNLKPALECFLEFFEKNNDKEIKLKIEKILSLISLDTE